MFGLVNETKVEAILKRIFLKIRDKSNIIACVNFATQSFDIFDTIFSRPISIREALCAVYAVIAKK